MPVQNAMVQGADPEVGPGSCQRSDVCLVRGRLEGLQGFAVIDQQTLLQGSKQQAARSERQQRRNLTRIGVPGPDLPEICAVECQHALPASSDQELRLVGVRERAHGHLAERNGWKLQSTSIYVRQCARLRVGIKPSRPGEIELSVKTCAGSEDGRCKHGCKSRIRERCNSAHKDAEISCRTQG